MIGSAICKRFPYLTLLMAFVDLYFVHLAESAAFDNMVDPDKGENNVNGQDMMVIVLGENRR